MFVIFFVLRLELETALTVASMQGSASIKVAILCRAGRHRSVAVAILLHGLLLRLGFRASLKHSNQRTWPGCKGLCFVCRKSPSEELIESLVKLWPPA